MSGSLGVLRTRDEARTVYANWIYRFRGKQDKIYLVLRGKKKKKSDGWNSETRVQKGKIERDRRAYETHERDSRTGLKRTIRCPNTTLYKNPWKLS